MTDLLPRSRRAWVIEVTVDGYTLDLDQTVFDTADEAVLALQWVRERLLESGQQQKVLNYLAEGGWVGEFQHYGASEPSTWRATYREQSIDE